MATDRPKMKDNFFKKTHQNFHKVKFQRKNRKEESVPVPSANSNNFFIESNDVVRSDRKPKTSKVCDFQEHSNSKTEKKPFDKKRYRLQKYSKKYQLQQWEDKRKKAVLHSYYKSLKEDQLNTKNTVQENLNKNDIDDKQKNDNISEKTLDTDKTNYFEDDSSKNSKARKARLFRKAHLEFQRIKEEKEKEKELSLKKKMKKEEALQKYKKNKIEKFKKLNKKTKKGQPIMKDRIEMLLEKIQNSVKQQ